jgi:hypothetical protein
MLSKYFECLANNWLNKLIDCQTIRHNMPYNNELNIVDSVEYAYYLCDLAEWRREEGCSLLFLPKSSRVKLVTGYFKLHECDDTGGRRQQKIPLTKSYFDSRSRPDLEYLLVYQKFSLEVPAILGLIEPSRLQELIDEGIDEPGNYSVYVMLDDFKGNYQMTDVVTPITDDLVEKVQLLEYKMQVQRRQALADLLIEHKAKNKPISLNLLRKHWGLYIPKNKNIPEFARR